ncbi:MAG: glycoside hydrolase family 3 C-terminal domain-containing protein [Treponema sp.]|jgi:beta-glucosidase|nr:glycoside hydrolase family 3 C-terminal domain-containing protein [Treponema sp.]
MAESDAKQIVAQMNLEEKASLCSGLDFWHLKGLAKYDLPAIMVTDGPHGLRKQEGAADHLGINQSVPATCFPPACALAASFNRDLAREVGAAVAEECLKEDVAVILGPGVNIKRSPLGGRNFEYLSEDPLLAGEIAAALIDGIQSKGVGTSIKHYAANNQEKERMISNSIVDERALREIYLTPFEIAVKKAQPWTVMCSYNQVDGVYAAENKKLLADILRTAWGFKGLVMTDWGAVAGRVEGIKAGLDLEMPASGGRNDAMIVAAVRSGALAEKILDTTTERIVSLILHYKAHRKPGADYDKAAHHALGRRAASDAAVLLKNEGNLLPLAETAKIAVIGKFAETPRYQGSGSSKINPHRVDNALDCLKAVGVAFDYAGGYSLKPDSPLDETEIDRACEIARAKDAAIIFAGLPDEYESEGFDRKSLALPESHNRLIEAVAAVNPNTVVVLQCGAPVLLPWADKVKAILLMYLGGQAVNSATVDLLLGRVAPGGKLPETFPRNLEDSPCYGYFPGLNRRAEYLESIFVGYRWYDTTGRDPAYPFGFGLSYTSFAISSVAVDQKNFRAGETITVSAEVTNTGKRPGAELVQVYVGMKGSTIFRPEKELRGFEKVYLEPGESKTISIRLDDRSFAYYNAAANCWAIEGGNYVIKLGTSSRSITAEIPLQVEGDGKETLLAALMAKTPSYFKLPKTGSFKPPDEEFFALYNKPVPGITAGKRGHFDMTSTLNDVKDTSFGKSFIKNMQKQSGGVIEDSEEINAIKDAMMMEIPFRTMINFSGGAMTPKMMEAFICFFNGKYLKGIMWLLRK